MRVRSSDTCSCIAFEALRILLPSSHSRNMIGVTRPGKTPSNEHDSAIHPQGPWGPGGDKSDCRRAVLKLRDLSRLSYDRREKLQMPSSREPLLFHQRHSRPTLSNNNGKSEWYLQTHYLLQAIQSNLSQIRIIPIIFCILSNSSESVPLEGCMGLLFTHTKARFLSFEKKSQ